MSDATKCAICGHWCCDMRDEPSHDHFLRPDQCPACALVAKRMSAKATPWGRFEIPRYALLDVWMALGGDSRYFDRWLDETPRRTPADAWAQLLAAVRGDLMTGDHNPPPGDALLALIWQREVAS